MKTIESNDAYEVLDSTSRPGYIKIRLRHSNKVLWARRKPKPEPGTETTTLTMKQAKLLGLLDWGKSAKPWKDMTEEEKRILSNIHPDNED